MSDIETQALRDLLLQSAARFSRGITTGMLQTTVTALGFELAAKGADSLDGHLLHLEGLKLLERGPKAHTPSFEVWKLTPAGDNYLRQQHLI